MAITPINLPVHAYKLHSARASSQRLVNCFAEAHPDQKSKMIVRGTPGITTFSTCGSGPVRGMVTMGGVLYVVSGDSLYSVSSLGVATNLGTGIAGTSPVTMADNGTQIVITNGQYGWIYDATNGFRTITHQNFYSANTVTYFKSLFCYDRVDTNEFFHSDVLDGENYSALNSGAAETSSDLVKAVTEYRGHLLVFGEKTIEPWLFSGADVFPFQQLEGSVIPRGLAASRAFVKEDDGIFMLCEDDTVVKLAGLQPQIIGTEAVSGAIQRMAMKTDAHAFTMSFGTHKFIVFQFPFSGQTWVYDVASKLWHERDTNDVRDNVIRWRGNCACSAYGKTFVGDFLTGKVGYLDASIATEFGDTVRMKMTFPSIHADGREIFCSWFELEMETGVGLAGGVQGSDPQVMASISVDAGNTFFPLNDWISLGQQGDRNKQMRWNQLGSFYDGVLQVEITDPVIRTVIGARGDIDVEAA